MFDYCALPWAGPVDSNRSGGPAAIQYYLASQSLGEELRIEHKRVHKKQRQEDHQNE